MSREKCPKCLFIQKRCLCKSLIELDSPIPIFIIQYPKEEKHALNTVNILKLNLKPLTIFNTEFIDREKQFREVIKNFKNPILIFPTPQALELENISNSDCKTIDAIIFIDGSWDKCKRIYFQSDILKTIKSFSLNSTHHSEYQIRKAPFQTSLSTIEAVTYSLNTIVNSQFDLLLNPFRQMINDQIESMGKDIFETNYKKKGSD
jgi:DTW domain-containing protein YfiP